MDSALGSIISKNGFNTEVNKYNREFFAKHLDMKKVEDLLMIKNTYVAIISFLEERFNSETTLQADNNLELISDNLEYIEELKRMLKSYEASREKSSKKITELYDLDDYEFSKINDLEIYMKQISEAKEKMHKDLKKLFDKNRSLMGQKKKYDEWKKSLKKDLKRAYDFLVNRLEIVDVNNMELFDCFESKEVLEEYEKGLKKIMPDDEERKVYLDYFLKLVKEDVKHIKSTVLLANEYVKEADESKDYYLPKLNSQNNQVYYHDFILDHINYILSLYFRGDRVIPNTRLLNAFKDIEEYVDGILDYSGNFDKYGLDFETTYPKYKEIIKEYFKIYEKNEKSRSNLSIIASPESYPLDSVAYQDICMSIVEQFVNKMYKDVLGNKLKKLDKPKNNLPEEKGSSKKFKEAPKKEEKKEEDINKNDVQKSEERKRAWFGAIKRKLTR